MRTFKLLRVNPHRITGNTGFLCDFSKRSTAIECLKHRVCASSCRRCISSLHRNRTIQDRVGWLRFIHKFHDVDRVVLRIILRSIQLSRCHLFQFCLHVSGEKIVRKWNIHIVHHALRTVDERCEVTTSLHLLIKFLHFGVECFAVCFTSRHFYINIFDIAWLLIHTEEFLVGLVSSFQIFVSDFQVLLRQRCIREASYFSGWSHRTSVILHLCSDGVGGKRTHKNRLILHHQQFTTQLLFCVSPKLIDCCNLLRSFRIRLLSLHCLCLLQEVLQSSIIKATSRLHKHWHILESLSSTFFNRLLHFLVCHLKT